MFFFILKILLNIFDSLGLPYKIPSVQPLVDVARPGGGLNCFSPTGVRSMCVSIPWSACCTKEAFNPGLIGHELGHGIVKSIQTHRKTNWCGWEIGCPVPTTSIVFHDFVNTIAHSFTESPCFPLPPSESCLMNSMITPFQLTNAGSKERAAGQSMASIVWSIKTKLIELSGEKGRVAYVSALMRTLTQYGWAETEEIRKSVIDCSFGSCKKLSIKELYPKYHTFALLFTNNLSFNEDYQNIAVSVFSDAKIFVSEGNQIKFEIDRKNLELIRVWNDKIFKCKK